MNPGIGGKLPSARSSHLQGRGRPLRGYRGICRVKITPAIGGLPEIRRRWGGGASVTTEDPHPSDRRALQDRVDPRATLAHTAPAATTESYTHTNSTPPTRPAPLSRLAKHQPRHSPWIGDVRALAAMLRHPPWLCLLAHSRTRPTCALSEPTGSAAPALRQRCPSWV